MNQVLVVESSMPTAVNAIVFATEYNCRPRLVAVGILASTLASVASITLDTAVPGVLSRSEEAMRRTVLSFLPAERRGGGGDLPRVRRGRGGRTEDPGGRRREPVQAGGRHRASARRRRRCGRSGRAAGAAETLALVEPRRDERDSRDLAERFSRGRGRRREVRRLRRRGAEGRALFSARAGRSHAERDDRRAHHGRGDLRHRRTLRESARVRSLARARDAEGGDHQDRLPLGEGRHRIQYRGHSHGVRRALRDDREGDAEASARAGHAASISCARGAARRSRRSRERFTGSSRPRFSSCSRTRRAPTARANLIGELQSAVRGREEALLGAVSALAPADVPRPRGSSQRPSRRSGIFRCSRSRAWRRGSGSCTRRSARISPRRTGTTSGAAGASSPRGSITISRPTRAPRRSSARRARTAASNRSRCAAERLFRRRLERDEIAEARRGPRDCRMSRGREELARRIYRRFRSAGDHASLIRSKEEETPWRPRTRKRT